MNSLSQSLSSLAFSESDLAIVVGLERAVSYNFRAALVLSPAMPDGRVAVRLLHGDRRQLSCRRHNLLRAAHPEDRARLLTLVVWERQLELRVARSFLLEKLGGEIGLALHVASFFPPRETLALTTGFAMGRIIPDWSCVTLPAVGDVHQRTPGVRFRWTPVHGKGNAVHGAHAVSDGIVRIDCAVVAIGAGRFVVAGGCADHPSRARKFFASAFIYDALTHAVTPLPDMPCARHGCGGGRLEERVYIVGGGYAAADRNGPLVSCLDLRTMSWSTVEEAQLTYATFIDALRSRGLSPEAEMRIFQRLFRAFPAGLAFVPVGCISGRLVIFVEGMPFAFNPGQPAAGWLPCADLPSTASLGLGSVAQSSIEWGNHLVLSTGRLDDEADNCGCHVAAFSFLHPLTTLEEQEVGVGALAALDRPQGNVARPLWAEGVWTKLGTTGATGRVGAGLTVVHDRLYVSGGVNESGRGGAAARFDGSVAQWSGTLAELDAAARGAGSGADGASADGAGVPAIGADGVRVCIRPWVAVEGLEMPTAMHAHAAIAVPWLP